MPSQKQIEANRRNAQKSTGPTSSQGKQASRWNALKHGMRAAEHAILPHEDRLAYAELLEVLTAEYEPAAASEHMLVETIANAYWRLLRARRLETANFRITIETMKGKFERPPEPREDDDVPLAISIGSDVKDDSYERIERFTAKIERCYFQAIETLRKMQKAREIRQHREQQRLRGREYPSAVVSAAEPGSSATRHSTAIAASSHASDSSANGFVRHNRREQIEEAQNAGFRTTETEHATIIHILPVVPAANRNAAPDTARNDGHRNGGQSDAQHQAQCEGETEPAAKTNK